MSAKGEHWADILTGAARGNLTRRKEGKHWQFSLNHRRIDRKAVFELMRSGFLEPSGVGPPLTYWQDISITVKGREALRKYPATDSRILAHLS